MKFSVLKTVGDFGLSSLWTTQLLQAIQQIHTECDFRQNPGKVFDHLLEILIDLTGSEFGFVGEFVVHSPGVQQIRIQAAGDVWLQQQSTGSKVDATKDFSDRLMRNPLIRRLIESRQPVISASPGLGLFIHGKAVAASKIKKLLFLPLCSGDELVGVIGLAHSASQFDEELIETLEPVLRTAGGCVAAYKETGRHIRAEKAQVETAQPSQAVTEHSPQPAIFATLTHELRTPLNAIQGILGLLQNARLPPREHELVRVARDSTKALLTIVRDVQDYSKIKAGTLRLTLAPTMPVWIIDSIVPLLDGRAHKAGVQLSSFVGASTPGWVISDGGRVRQILVNLVDNAIKHSRAAHINLSVEALAIDHLRFTVADDGIGVSGTEQPTLFDDYRQAGASSSLGTGLGLGISRQLVELLGGEMGFTSSENAGSSFWFTIAAQAAGDSSNQPGISREFDGVRVLLAAEKTPQRDVLIRQLREWGVIVHESRSMCSPAVELFLRQACRDKLVLADRQFVDDPDAMAMLDLLRKEGVKLVWLWSSAEGAVLQQSEHDVDWHLGMPIIQSQLRHRIAWGIGRENVGHGHHYTPESVRALLPPQGVRVLLVEDSSARRMVGESALQRNGFQTDSVANGREAVEAVSTLPYDIVLMDLNMPVMGGIEATRRIRALEGHSAVIPVIGMTENASADEEQAWRRAGVSDLITQVISGGSVLEALLKWMPDARQPSDRLDMKELADDRSDPVRVDRDAIQQLIMDSSREQFPEMIRVFVRELRDRVGIIEAAAQSGELTVIDQQSHTLMSSARTFGAAAVHENAARLHEASRQQNIAEVVRLAAELTAECGPSARALQDLCHATGDPTERAADSSTVDA